MAIPIGLCLCVCSLAQTNAPDYEYSPSTRPPAKPSPWLPYGVAGVPEQVLRVICAPAEWAANKSERSMSGWGTSPLSSEQPSSGFFPLLDYSTAQGAGLGVGYYDENFLAKSQLLRVEGTASTEDAERFSVSLSRPMPESRFELGASFNRDANSEFYGFGNRTEESDRTFFEWIEGRGWFAWKQPLPAGLEIEGTVALDALSFDADGGEDGPRIRKKFALSSVPGFQADPDLVEFTAALSHRFRPVPTNSPGTVAFSEQASFSWYQTLSGGDFDFLKYSLAANVTVPLGKPRRELRAQLHWEEARADGGNVTPCVFEPTLGENTGLRGFGRDRYRDQATALASFEYRFPTWAVSQGMVFYDVGRVFRGADHFGLESWRW